MSCLLSGMEDKDQACLREPLALQASLRLPGLGRAASHGCCWLSGCACGSGRGGSGVGVGWK